MGDRASGKFFAHGFRPVEAVSLVAKALDNALAAKDRLVRQHCIRVGAMTRRIAQTLLLSEEAVAAVEMAGTLHDLGKIGVDDSIIRKPARLSPREEHLMRLHPMIGSDIVAPFEFFTDAQVIIRHYHERMDGTGYPDSLVGDAIPFGARIVSVADIYDALTSDRPYRAAMPSDDALTILEAEAGSGIDRTIFGALLATLSRPERNSARESPRHLAQLPT